MEMASLRTVKYGSSGMSPPDITTDIGISCDLLAELESGTIGVACSPIDAH